MSWLSDLTASVAHAQELYYTVDLQLDRLQKDMAELAQQVAVLRHDCNNLSVRVPRLEEGRSAIDAQVAARVETALAKVIADLRVDYAQTRANLMVEFAQTDGQSPAAPPSAPTLPPGDEP